MKKQISVILAICMALILAMGGAMAEGGRQTASTVLDRDGEAVVVTVDLTGGWSVEFAAGALYLYDGEITEGREADAIGDSAWFLLDVPAGADGDAILARIELTSEQGQ